MNYEVDSINAEDFFTDIIKNKPVEEKPKREYITRLKEPCDHLYFKNDGHKYFTYRKKVEKWLSEKDYSFLKLDDKIKNVFDKTKLKKMKNFVILVDNELNIYRGNIIYFDDFYITSPFCDDEDILLDDINFDCNDKKLKSLIGIYIKKNKQKQ